MIDPNNKRHVAYVAVAAGLLTGAVMVVVLLLFGGCCFRGPGQPRAVVGVSSLRRHNIQPRLGMAYEWDTGAQVRAVWTPQLRIEDPSTRGEPEEIGAFLVEVEIPVGRR